MTQTFESNRVVQDTGCRFPIFNAPVGYFARAQLPGAISAAGGMGLNIMRYRARTLGGVLEIYPNTPSGTVVSCVVRCDATASAAAGLNAAAPSGVKLAYAHRH